MQTAQAEVRVTEIMSNPESGEKEWILISSDEGIDISHFSFADEAAFAKGKTFFEIEEETFIEANSEMQFLGWGNVLNNTGDILYFFDAEQNLLQQITIPSLEKGEICHAEESTCIPTETSPPEEPEESGSLNPDTSFIVTEVLTNGEAEWVTIKSTSTETQNIGGILFADENSDFFEIPTETILEAGAEMTFLGWSAKLNNSGDTLIIKTPSGEIVEEIALPSLEKDEICRVENHACSEEKEEEKEEPNATILNPDTNFVVTEILTNGEAEWVKIKSTAEEVQSLGGIIFADENSDFFEIPTETILEAGAEMTFLGWGSVLNNTGDILFVKNPNGEILKKIELPSLAKNEICRVEKEKCTKTEGHSSGGSSGKIPPLLKTKAAIPSVGAENIVIRFSEVRFRSEDFDVIELFCEKCDTDLAGIRLADDDTFFEFPEKSEIESGAFIVIFLDGEEVSPEKADGAHLFHAKKKDLTATDETLFLIDSRGEIISAVCIANQNGKFSPGEENDVKILARLGAIRGIHPLDESICADSRPLKKGISLVFFRDEKSPPEDSFWTEESSFGSENPPPPDTFLSGLKITEARKIPEERIILTLENTAKMKIATRGFRVEVDGEVVEVPNKTLYPRQKIIISIASGESIFLKDFWGKSASEIKGEEILDFDRGVGSVQISEILPNPEGKDERSEFVEFECMAEKCDLRHFLILINDKEMRFSRTSARKNEFFSESLSLKNESGEITLLDLEKGTFESVEWSKALEGKSLVAGEWTDFPTPNAENFVGKKGEDRNKNGIPDEMDFALGDMATKIFPRILEKRITLEVTQNEQDEIIFSGSAPPKTEVFGMFAGEKFKGTTDKEGRFEVRLFPSAVPKKRSIATLARFPDGAMVRKDIDFLNIRNPRENWIEHLEIVAVLPNPNGNDAGAEKIILRNLDEKDGWIRNMSFEIGGKTKAIPEIFVKSGEEIELSKKEIPSLRNKNGEISLKNIDGRVLSQVSWKNAKSGVFYGKNFPEEEKSFSSSKKKTVPLEAPPKIEEIYGRIIQREKKVIILENEAGRRSIAIMDESFDRTSIDRLITQKKMVTAHIFEKKLTSIDPEITLQKIPVANNPKALEGFLVGIEFFALVLLGVIRLLIFLEKKRTVNNALGKI